MGKAIVVSLAIIIIISIVAFAIGRAHKRATSVGDLDLAQERQLRRLTEDAARVMRGIGSGMTIEDSDVISERSRSAVDEWLFRYDDYTDRQKEINA